MPIHFDNEIHCGEFVRLDETWVAENCQLEESDRKMAANPMQVIADGGDVISLAGRAP